MIVMILIFYRINFAKHYCPIDEVAMHLAPHKGVASLTDAASEQRSF